MSKAWGGLGGLGGAGAWALDAERAEEEERENAAAPPEPPAPAAGFPSLREAAAGAAAGKSKKKKGTTLSLSEFTTYGAAGRRPAAAAAEPKGLTPQEMMMLPTGPRERSAEELDRSRLGGGFRSYGSGERRGGFDDDGRRGGPGRDADLDMPSRADESGNWSLNKKSFAPSPADSGARSRYGSLGGGGAAAASSFGRADDDGDWSRGKKPMPMPSRYPSLGSGGGGFRDSPTSTDSDRWSRAAPPPSHNGERERPRLVLDPPKRDASATPTPPPAEAPRSRPSPFGAARPREDILAEKGLDWRKMETEIDHKTSRPTSSQSSRPGSAHSSRPGSPGSQTSAVGSEAALRARPKVNPFGDAKPREVVLQEKGKDWRKIDLELEHRRIDRPETNEEKDLKEEINLLRVDLKETEANISDEDKKGLSEKLSQMERELERLTIELDNKVRFGQRPGSGSGKVTAHLSNSADESQIIESTEQPRSRSSIDHNPKPAEERWGFQGNRDRGSFGGNRSTDRSLTGQRW
uniref:Eukaryotic translation initiation factor 4B1 n=1 Tax=Oryza punctata TaxID=4537 RepID=A0A0E0K1X4_ORYPU